MVTTHHPAQVSDTCLPLLLGDCGCCLRKVRSKEKKSLDVASPFPKPQRAVRQGREVGTGTHSGFGSRQISGRSPVLPAFYGVHLCVFDLERKR